MRKKAPKRYDLVKDYFLKICDRGHHSLKSFTLSPEELHNGRIPNGYEFVEFSEWDKYLEGKGRANTADLIKRDIKVFWAVENIRDQKKISIEDSKFAEGAVSIAVKTWSADLGPHLGESVVAEIYKNYAPVFRFLKNENSTLNFPLRDAAAYALREMKVLNNWFPNIPPGICEDLHKIFKLPVENNIEKEIEIYQRIRNKSFGVTYLHPLRLKQISMGDFNNRFENRSERITNAIKDASTKYNIEFSKIIEFYHHYRLIEADDNNQDRLRVYERLQSDLRDIFSA